MHYPNLLFFPYPADQQAMIEELKRQLELKEKRNKILEQKAMIQQLKNQLESKEKQNQILETKIKNIGQTDSYDLDFDHDEKNITKNDSEIINDVDIDLKSVDFSPMKNQVVEKMEIEISPMKIDSMSNENITTTSVKNSNSAKNSGVGISRILSRHFGMAKNNSLKNENVTTCIENTIDKINFSEEKIQKTPVKIVNTLNSATSGISRASAIRNEEINNIKRKYFTFDPVKYPFRCRLLYCHFGAKRNEELNEHIMEKHPTCSLARTLFNSDVSTVSSKFSKKSAI